MNIEEEPTVVSDDVARDFYSHLRPAVRAFALKMEEKLRRNEHKGSWSEIPAATLFERLSEEVTELHNAVWGGEGATNVGLEGADVANFAMMIADNEGGLREDASRIGSGR